MIKNLFFIIPYQYGSYDTGNIVKPVGRIIGKAPICQTVPSTFFIFSLSMNPVSHPAVLNSDSYGKMIINQGGNSKK